MYRINLAKFMERAKRNNIRAEVIQEISSLKDDLYDLDKLESFYSKGEEMRVYNVNGWAIYENEFTGGWCRL